MKEGGDVFEQDNMTVNAIEESDQWGALADKGYTRARRLEHFTIPKKQRAGNNISAPDKNWNKRIESDCVIV